MASLSCGGPLKCLRIMGKKATAWRMNQSIEPILSLTSSLPFSLLLVHFSFLSPSLPIFLSFASRSVLSWNIYSSPGPASLNRHTNSRLNIARCSLHAFPSVSSPKTQQSAIHTRSLLQSQPPSASTGSLQDALRRMTVGRKCTHAPHDPPPRLAAAHSFCERRKTERAEKKTLLHCCFNLLRASLVLSHDCVAYSLHSW